MGHLSVISGREEQVLVKWTTDCFWKGFLQRKLGVQLSFKEPNCKAEKHLLKIMCPEKEHFDNSFVIILCCPLALVKM